MQFRVGVIGAGWYGCHIAHSLANLGFDVTLFDRHSRVMHEASGNNQFRLHLGFHYARHHGTRLQSRDGFQRFIERYPTLSAEVTHNIYAVPKQGSLLDFSTYKLIMAASGIDFLEMHEMPGFLQAVEGCLQTRERVICLHRARDFFQSRLAGCLQLDAKAQSVRDMGDYAEIDGRRFDYIIDATWGHLRQLPIDVYFEPTLLLYYESKDQPALTFVDGPLCSIYPTEDPQIYTLSSVIHTSLGRYATAGEAQARHAEVDLELVREKQMAMEDQISGNFPAFRDVFRFAGIQLAIKTKPVATYDDRSCYVFQSGRIFSVMSGKIDTIFFATERILSMMAADNSVRSSGGEATSIRQNILMPGV